MRRFWPRRTVAAIEPALARQELGWLRFYLPTLLSEMRASIPLESGWERLKQQTREWRRVLQRALNPTGMSIAVCGGTAQQRAEVAMGLEGNLAPAFRRTMICGDDAVVGTIRGAASTWLAKVRSTLVIRKEDKAKARWRDEICFVFRSPEAGGATRERCVALDGTHSPQQNVEHATRVTLEWLAARLQRRLKLEHASSAQRRPERGMTGAS